jgi:uncharacterized HAD superfamily protein
MQFLSKKMLDSYPKTYFIDIDGTIVPNLTISDLEKYIHVPNYIQDLLPGVKKFFETLYNNDVVIFTTARGSQYKELTERTLRHHRIKYHQLIMDLPIGQRVLINDSVNMLYQKAIAINVLRNHGMGDVGVFNPEN